jgi:SAM-dependent methyltransferase
MPEETKRFAMFPHNWHSTDSVTEWITRDAARDPERRPLLQQMLSFAPFPCDAELEVLDVGAGYGVVSEEVLQAFPAARVALQDFSQPMLDRARQRLADRSGQLSYFLCDLVDRSWPKQVGGPFNLAVSAIALHNLRDPEKIFACYRAIHDLLNPDGCFLNCDRFVEGVEPHMAALREAGFGVVECPWREAPRAIVCSYADWPLALCLAQSSAFEHEARPIGTATAEIAAARLNGPSGRVRSYPVECLG